MSKIILAIMLIFIASTNCALEDCSREELEQIAIKASAAFRKAYNLPSVQLPFHLKGIQIHDLSQEIERFETKDLIREIRRLPIKKGNVVISSIQDIIDNSLLALRKFHIYPVFEIVSNFEKEDLLKFCKTVEDYARSKHLFMGGLMNNISEDSSNNEISEALKSFAESWGVSRQELMNIANQVVNYKVLYNAQRLTRDENFYEAVLNAYAKIEKEDKELFQKLKLDTSCSVDCWEILANSQILTGEELVMELHALVKSSS